MYPAQAATWAGIVTAMTWNEVQAEARRRPPRYGSIFHAEIEPVRRARLEHDPPRVIARAQHVVTVRSSRRLEPPSDVPVRDEEHVVQVERVTVPERDCRVALAQSSLPGRATVLEARQLLTASAFPSSPRGATRASMRAT